MDNKPVRRYSRWKQGLKWGKYAAHWSVLAPTALLMLLLLVVGGYYTFVFGTMLLYGVLDLGTLAHLQEKSPVSAFYMMRRLDILLCGLIGTGLCALLVFGAKKFIWLFFSSDLPTGHVLRPILPTEENPVLPDEQLLVRASAPNSETQRAELLRASTDTAETPPEQLLRATNGKEA